MIKTRTTYKPLILLGAGMLLGGQSANAAPIPIQLDLENGKVRIIEARNPKRDGGAGTQSINTATKDQSSRQDQGTEMTGALINDLGKLLGVVVQSVSSVGQATLDLIQKHVPGALPGKSQGGQREQTANR